MLIEQLFASGLMQMGPSREDPARKVGVFNPARVAELPALRAAEIKKFEWLACEWDHENLVPATSHSPAYSDIGVSRFTLCEDDGWICIAAPDGRMIPHITFDPFSRQWIYVLIRGSYGILRSPHGWQDSRIVFTGPMIMIGIDCEWRITFTRHNDDHFSFVNEERAPDGKWSYIDEWQFHRRPTQAPGAPVPGMHTDR